MQRPFVYIAVSYLVLFCFGFADNGRSASFPQMIAFFGITNLEAAQIFAFSSITSLLANLVGRHWLKWLGDWSAQRVFVLLVSIGCFGIGMSGVLKSFPLILASSALLGLGMGGSAICVNSIVGRLSSTKNRRRLFSGLHSMYGVASVIAPLAFVAFAEEGVSWIYVFMMVAVIPLTPFVLSFFFPPLPKPLGYSSKPIGVSWRRRYLIGALIGFGVCAEMSVATRITQYATMAYQAGSNEASIYLAMFFVFLMLGRFLFATVHFERSSLWLMMVSVGCTFFVYVIGLLVHPAVLSLVGFTISFFFPCATDWISKHFKANAGFMLTSALTINGIALVLLQWALGALTDFGGIRLALCMGPVFCALAVLICLMLKTRYPFDDGKKAPVLAQAMEI